jgi:hypothetical protein
VHFDVGRKTRRRSSSLEARGLMVRYYFEGCRTQLFLLPHLARMIRIVIEEITEVVEVVVVVDMSSLTKTKVHQHHHPLDLHHH